jgi:hypothetical protein
MRPERGSTLDRPTFDDRPAFQMRLVTVAIVAAMSTSGCFNSSSPPQFYTEMPFVDLGVLDPGKHSFAIEIANHGGGRLCIEKVISSCSCTIANPPIDLTPGGRGQIRGTVSVGAGPGSARLFIAGNDQVQEHVVHLTWFGKSTPKILPPLLHISKRSDETAVRDIEISYPGGASGGHLTLLGAHDLPEGVSLEEVSDDPFAIRAIPGFGAAPNEAPWLIVGKALLKLKCSGSVRGSITRACTVNVEQRGVKHQLPLTIIVDCDEGLRAKPQRLLFSANSIDELKRLQRKTTVSSDTDGDAQLEIVEKPPYLDVHLTKRTDSPRETTLAARVLSPPPTGQQKAEVVVRNSGGAQIKIPIYIAYEP